MAERIKVVPDTGLILQATLDPKGPVNQVLDVLDAGETGS